MSKLPSQKLLKKSECRDLKGEEVKHFNFAGWYHAGIHGVGSSSGKGIHDAGVFRRGAGAGIATAISFVPFRSEIAYNAEIKRPREPPGRHVSPRDHEGEDDRGKYGNLPTPWHRNSISARCILRDTLNDTRPRYFHRSEIRWTRCTRFDPPVNDGSFNWRPLGPSKRDFGDLRLGVFLFVSFFFRMTRDSFLLLPRSKKMSKFPGLLPPSLLKPTNQWTILPASDSPSCPRDNRERGMDRCIGTEQT